MSSPGKTPSSPNQAGPTNSPMPLPATPGACSPTVASSPSAVAPKTPGASIRTANGTLRTCSADPSLMTVVKVHTAKCTECDKRNRDTMLRCPGCTFQICRPCCERREKKGRGLAHGGMLSPGGLGSGLGGLGSGTVVRRRVPGMESSPVKKTEKPVVDMALSVDGSKDKGKAVKKRSAAKGKSKAVVLDQESSDDDFMPDPTSPTSNKRRRTTLNITDTPTATSARPSRTAPLSAHTPAYVAPSSPSSSSVSGADTLAATSRPSNLNSAQVKKAWDMETRDVAPTGRIQELLEQHGVNTPSNRYEEHFLRRYEPVVTNRIISIPEAVRRMADPKPWLSAEQKVDARNRAMLVKAEEDIKALTVRGIAEGGAKKYQSQDLSDDENEELASAIKEAARKWALRTQAGLPKALQTAVVRTLDMRLDQINTAYKTQLVGVIEQCAIRKLKEFEQDRDSAMPTPE